jgi:hypothetical protein
VSKIGEYLGAKLRSVETQAQIVAIEPDKPAKNPVIKMPKQGKMLRSVAASAAIASIDPKARTAAIRKDLQVCTLSHRIPPISPE